MAEAVEKNLSRSERRRMRTRAQLIEGARKVMGEKGVDATTIRDITEEADVGFGSFYNYFESKEAITDEIIREIIFQSGELIDARIESLDDPAEVMAVANMSFLKLVQLDPILCWFVVRVGSARPEIGANLKARMMRDLKLGIEAGRFTVPDVDTTAAMITGSVLNYTRERLGGNIGEEADVHLVHSVQRLLGVTDDEARRVAEFAEALLAQAEE